VEIYETKSGNLLGDFVKESMNYKGLLDAIRENAPDLFAKITPETARNIFYIAGGTLLLSGIALHIWF